MFQPIGTFLVIQTGMGPIFTNALSDRLYIPSHFKMCLAKINFEDELKVECEALSKTDIMRDLARCGFIDERIEEVSSLQWEGKFVYLHNGTFFFASPTLSHHELCLRYDMIARSPACMKLMVRSAGFIRVLSKEHTLSRRVCLYGKSVSLDGVRPTEDQSDEKAIATHLGIEFKAAPKVQEASA